MKQRSPRSPVEPRYRSGAAARMARMPVATLRVWERRYQLGASAKAPSGHRLYSDADVHRLALLKRLVDQGHGIGTLAALQTDQLEHIAAALPVSDAAACGEHVRAGVVGERLLARVDEARNAGLDVVAAHAGLDAALQASPVALDALLVHLPSLQMQAAQALLQLADRCGARGVLVFYAFGTGAATDTLRLAGVRLYRESLGTVRLTQLLGRIRRALTAGAGADNHAHWGRVPRRYSDQALATIGERSSTVACECPRHLAEMIAQASAFESYSDSCAGRSPADATLHRYLGDVANRARSLFETALERLVREEGWTAHEPDAVPARGD